MIKRVNMGQHYKKRVDVDSGYINLGLYFSKPILFVLG